MYIIINGAQHLCANYRASPGVSATFYGVEGVTLPISGEVSLHADDGFELARQNADNFARQTYENGVLTLTNELEQEPEIPEDEEPQTDPIADLFEVAIDHEYRLILMELGV